jgi:aryl-alcohol dehydrogenase-like predicted oxidoreductase
VRRTTFDFPPVDTERAWACVKVMREIGKAHGVSAARVALAWLLAKAHVMTVIIGAKTVDQLADNLAAVDLMLQPDELHKLDDAPCRANTQAGCLNGKAAGAGQSPSLPRSKTSCV